jgi:hypothetical protein
VKLAIVTGVLRRPHVHFDAFKTRFGHFKTTGLTIAKNWANQTLSQVQLTQSMFFQVSVHNPDDGYLLLVWQPILQVNTYQSV